MWEQTWESTKLDIQSSGTRPEEIEVKNVTEGRGNGGRGGF